MKGRTCQTTTCRKWANLNKDGFCPSCAPPALDLDQETVALNCNICNIDIEEECKVIGCDLCNKWYHSKCVGPEDLVKLLEAISEDDSSPSKFLGLLLWVCPNCNEKPAKFAKIVENTCSLAPDPSPENSNPTKEKSGTICKNYRHGTCLEGTNCKYSHPQKCLDYCRYGRDGCSGGFNKCKLLHPVLCRGSLNYKRCYDETCTLAHLKGTNRKRNPMPAPWHNDGQHRHRQQGRVNSQQYSAIDSHMLGFQGYQPPWKHRENAPRPNNVNSNVPRPKANDRGFCYNEDEFPMAQANQNVPSANKSPNNEQHFLDLLQSIKTIQETQQFFQQELISIKSLLPPPQLIHPQMMQTPLMSSQLSTQFQGNSEMYPKRA